MALSVVYFRITHRLGRPHYVWDEYLYSVREKVEVRVSVSVTVCVVLLLDDDERKGEVETRCRLIACLLEKHQGGRHPRTNRYEQYYGYMAMNSTICLLNIHTAEGFGI